MLMFNTINGLSPAQLQNLLKIRSTLYNLRDPEIKLDLPRHTRSIESKALATVGAPLSNSLPLNLRKLDSLGRFKRELDRLYNNSQSGSQMAIL